MFKINKYKWAEIPFRGYNKIGYFHQHGIGCDKNDKKALDMCKLAIHDMKQMNFMKNAKSILFLKKLMLMIYCKQIK